MPPVTESKARRAEATRGNKKASNSKTSGINNPSTGTKKNVNKSRPAASSMVVSSTSKLAASTQSTDLKTASKFEEYSKKAHDLKSEILVALEKQAAQRKEDDNIGEPIEIVRLRDDVAKLSASGDGIADIGINKVNGKSNEQAGDTGTPPVGPINETKITFSNQQQSQESSATEPSTGEEASVAQESKTTPSEQSIVLKVATSTQIGDQKKSPKISGGRLANDANCKTTSKTTDDFEPLEAKLDKDSQYVALVSSLQNSLGGACLPEAFEPICRKLVDLSWQNNNLATSLKSCQADNDRLSVVKQKLENLCRELQKSNNAIRIESLELIKAEQAKAKEQTTKIQSTLSGVIKLFDENQQRNMSLRQENIELQSKLKSLLQHCDNWEKSVETMLKQRDIENRLAKMELAKANLIQNEEREKFMTEKQELLRVLALMQEQQQRIEGQEARLRSDLSSYASKYDECQAIFSKGMGKFQTESQRMLKQLERSKQDYKMLLGKYETTAKRTAQLLLEKQHWDRTKAISNKKIDALERLCRALRNTANMEDAARAGQAACGQAKTQDQAGTDANVAASSAPMSTNSVDIGCQDGEQGTEAANASDEATPISTRRDDVPLESQV